MDMAGWIIFGLCFLSGCQSFTLGVVQGYFKEQIAPEMLQAKQFS